MTCQKCGTTNIEDAIYCLSCGAKIEHAPAADDIPAFKTETAPPRKKPATCGSWRKWN